MKKKKVNLIISFIIGIALFIATIAYFGLDSLKLVYENITPIYLIPYAILTTLTFFASTWRLQVILKAYEKKVPFFSLLYQNIAGYALCYVTPAVRLGGEPLKAYMLKKENNIDLKTGSSALILDKFVELFGSAIIGIIGLILLFFLPNISPILKIILAIIIILGVFILFIIYYLTITDKGPFLHLYKLLEFFILKKSKKFEKILKQVEDKMKNFFVNHKKEFLISFSFYCLYGFISVFELKFLLLALGIQASITEAILILVVLGIVNLIPVPAGLGFLEAGQSGLFEILKSSGVIGLAFSLLIRLRNITFTVIGFALISYFSGKQIINKKEKKNIIKKRKQIIQEQVNPNNKKT